MTGRRFRPGLLPTVAVAVLTPSLAALGFWQLDRADQKRRLKSNFESGAETVSLSGEEDIAGLGDLRRYQRIVMEGRFDSGRQFLIDNITDGGAAGYYVLTPFAPAGASTWVVVNRGWVARDFSAAALPDVAIDETPRRLLGRVARLPRPGLELAGAETAQSWPRVVQFPTMVELEEILQRQLAPVSVLLDADADDGFLRRWRPAELGPERHVGYAVQWFALALTLVIIYLIVNLKRSKDD